MQRLIVCCFLCAATACQEPALRLLSKSNPGDAGFVADAGSPVDFGLPPDTGVVVDTGPIDTGVMDSGVDAGPDVGVEPRRRLVEYSLLGETSVGSLVLNPRLDLSAALGPGGFGGGNLEVHERLGAPGAMPVLSIPSNTPVLIPVMTVPGDKSVSIWVGQQGRPPTAQVFLLGLDNTFQEVQVPLQQIQDEEEEGGIFWGLYQATVLQPSKGLAFLAVVGARFVTAPEAIPLDTAGGAGNGLARPRTQPQAIDAVGRQLFRMIGSRMQDHARNNIQLPKVERGLKTGPKLRLRSPGLPSRRHGNKGPAPVRRERKRR